VASSDADKAVRPDRRRRLAGRVVLAAGVGMLLLVIGLSVARHNREVEREGRRADAQRATYTKLLRQAAQQPPRFEVSYVEFDLEDLDRLTIGSNATGRANVMVQTEVAQRITTGRPPIHPDLAVMPHHRFFNSFVQAFSERRVRNAGTGVLALLVTQAGPGQVSQLRLQVNRLALRGFDDIWDARDITPSGGDTPGVERFAPVGSRRTEVVKWTPSAGREGALVPLALVHNYYIPRTTANADIIRQASERTDYSLIEHVVLVPHVLSVERPTGRDLRVAMRSALANPLVLGVGPP
jgi:hypothetical protein